MMQSAVWVSVGVAIGMIAHVSALRPLTRAWYVDALTGAAFGLLGGASFSVLGAQTVRGLNAFEIDPVAFYAVLAAALAASAAFLVREFATNGSARSRTASRRLRIGDAARLWLVRHSAPLVLFRRDVKESVRLSAAKPAYAKGRAR